MIRVAICKQRIKSYRLPLFNLLAAQDGVELSVFGSREWGEASPVFTHVEAETRQVRWLPGSFWHQPAQLEVVDPARFDLVILPWNTRSRTLAASTRLARRRGLPVVLWGHGYSKRPSWWRDRVRNRAGRRADAVLMYTKTIARELVERWGFPRDHVFVAQNAIDQTPVRNARRHWAERPDELARFRAAHGIDPTRTIAFVSRLVPENRVELLLHGLARLRRIRPEARLVIVGDGPAKPALERLARELGQQGHVVFPGAIFDDMRLAPWMLSAAFYSYPVRIGLSLQHAFGYALPVVTSDDIGNHGPEIEALLDGTNGLLYRDGDVDDLVDKWTRLLDEDTLRQTLGANALRQVTEHYSLPNMAQGFLDLMSIVDGEERRVVAPGDGSVVGS